MQAAFPIPILLEQPVAPLSPSPASRTLSNTCGCNYACPDSGDAAEGSGAEIGGEDTVPLDDATGDEMKVSA